ncbi:MAG TPA: response regulator, partial [Terriglobia bacterium]|nr:response regulator [Terriglobia bacterium]
MGEQQGMLETKQVTLRCPVCRAQKSYALNGAQVRQLRGGISLQFHCSYCGSPRFWTPVNRDELSETDPADSRNILLVDDDELILQLLRKVLQSWETSIDVSANGKEALAKLASRTFDLLVCDLQMPEMSGDELFRHIRENALIPPERIIFLTGDKRPQTRQFLRDCGCHYLFKPIQFLEFSAHVQAVLGLQ